MLVEGEIENTTTGRLQKRQLACNKQEIDYVRLVILSGWDDFCTVHNIQVDGERVISRKASTWFANGVGSSGRGSDFANLGRRPSEIHGHLEVSIPEHEIKEKNVPDTPRKLDTTRTWGLDGRRAEARSE